MSGCTTVATGAPGWEGVKLTVPSSTLHCAGREGGGRRGARLTSQASVPGRRSLLLAHRGASPVPGRPRLTLFPDPPTHSPSPPTSPGSP
jgi:hypothetical protein